MKSFFIAATAFLLAVAVLLGACSPSAPAPSATPGLFPTLDDTPQPATLPPTWTPTFTPSPAPPTATPTLPPSPTPAPTLTAGETCERFELLYEIPPRKVFRWHQVIPFAITLDAPDVTVRFVATHRATGENQGIQLEGQESYLFEFPVNLLPRPGLYDWELVVQSAAYGDLCQREGVFFALQLDTPEASPEAAATAEASPVAEGD